MSKRPVSSIVAGAAWIGGFANLMQHEMWRQGWTNEQIHALVAESNPEDQPFKQIVANLNRFPSQIYAPDWIPSGCKVLDDPPVPPFEMEDLEWLPVLDESKLETFVWGENMRDWALANNAAFGLTEGKYFWEHQDKIPVDIAVVLAGTLLFDTADRRLKVCQLYREKPDGPLFKNYPVLHFGWYGQHRLPHIKHI